MSSVFLPKTEDEALSWVQARIADKTPFRIRAEAQPHPDSDTDVLATSALDSLSFFHPDDMVIGVASGMPFDKLHQMLGEKKMCLVVNPWFRNQTVGQVLATNQYGPNRMTSGGIRDELIGVGYINGFGKQVKAGGQMVKNVTGYDVCKMMVGSRGGFGPITRANFKMKPAPIEPHGLYFEMAGNHWLAWFRDEVYARRLPLDWAQAVHKQGVWRLGLGISGNAQRRERLISELQKAFDGQLVPARDGEEALPFQNFSSKVRYAGFLSPHLAEYNEPSYHLHVSLPTAPLLERVRLMDHLTSEDATLVLHPVGADFHMIGAAKKLTEERLDTLRRLLSGTGAYLTQEKVTPDLLKTFGYSVPLPSEYPLMQRLKRTLDPAGVFQSPFYEML